MQEQPRTTRMRQAIKRTRVGHAVRTVVRRPEDLAAEAYRQAEAVAALYHLLQPARPLPPLRRDWVISPDLGVHVVDTALTTEARSIVEFGSGASTILLGLALRRLGGGHLTSYDHSAEWIARTEEEVARHGVADLVTIRHAPLRPIPGTSPGLGEKSPTVWYSIPEAPSSVDLALVDGPPWETRRLARHPTLGFLAPRLAPGASVFLDDADRDDERETLAAWMIEHPGVRVEWLDCEKGGAQVIWPDRTG